jgi:hypothetical protein
MCKLNGFEAILGNTLLNTYHIDFLKGGSKFKIVARLIISQLI